ncbi:MAG: cardiolipin synthase [Candidatus Cloacimonetes bacterium]|nr:cardiolipin synthase [Candidatus Cloacimonadota bacterium]MCF7814474.1 cardiolipin synthase [Candidatus Cloacimonadota bacterium]MCF7867866.1 cardiolipin synthase [Candidatus Cloacimonadota bacterium]MCF7883685.1 cardiolipin synthase [Candidatus Cloacimonadota bacterium]
MLDVIHSFWYVIVVVIYILGIIASLDAIWKGRTAQGSIAWAVSLIVFPYLALPLYYIFGDRKFYAYVKAMRSGNVKIKNVADCLLKKLEKKNLILEDTDNDFKVMEKLARLPFTKGNRAKLLIDGNETFKDIFKGIEEAKDYVLIQFYMVHDDVLGRQLKDLLVKKNQEGVRIYFLYDDIGSHLLPKSYVEELREKGIQITSFKTRKRFSFKLRLNFRNHRKIVIVDGKKAYVGGCNISKKYLGIHPKYGYWRDTHVMIEGPAVQTIQLPFLSDWYWVTNFIPDLNWEPEAVPGCNNKVLSVSSGPADEQETCGIFFVQAINSAKKRLWIVSPYFVPDQQVLTSLQLAAMRGVDVRLVIPQKSDLLLTYLSSFSYLEETTRSGVKVYRYKKGFLHEKVMLIDDDKAVVGTANLDNRSFRINFEINLLFSDKNFASRVEAMLNDDLQNSFQVGVEDYSKRPIWFKLAVKIARLMSPVQ